MALSLGGFTLPTLTSLELGSERPSFGLAVPVLLILLVRQLLSLQSYLPLHTLFLLHTVAMKHSPANTLHASTLWILNGSWGCERCYIHISLVAMHLAETIKPGNISEKIASPPLAVSVSLFSDRFRVSNGILKPGDLTGTTAQNFLMFWVTDAVCIPDQQVALNRTR